MFAKQISYFSIIRLQGSREVTDYVWQVSMLNAYRLHAASVAPDKKPKTLQFRHAVGLLLNPLGIVYQQQ